MAAPTASSRVFIVFIMPDSTPCSRCGTPTDIHVGDRPICEDCYAALASCCSGEFEAGTDKMPIS